MDVFRNGPGTDDERRLMTPRQHRAYAMMRALVEHPCPTGATSTARANAATWRAGCGRPPLGHASAALGRSIARAHTIACAVRARASTRAPMLCDS